MDMPLFGKLEENYPESHLSSPSPLSMRVSVLMYQLLFLINRLTEDGMEANEYASRLI